jgi:formylglycine-generating enzyme required for sulfatase activity
MAKPRFTRRCDCVRGVGMFRAGGLVSSVLICGLSASEAICQTEQQEQSRSPISVDMRRATPLGWQEEHALKPLDMFKECEVCPEMIVVPAGGFMRGAPKTEDGSEDNERPEHMVTIAKPFSVGGFAVTFEEWDACVADGGCRRYRPGDRGWGRGRRPVINLSWGDAKAYTKWLSEKTGRGYRLLSEAEREYVTRAGTNTPFWWGVSISTQHANYDGEFAYPTATGQVGEFRRKTLPVDAFAPNPWGLYQVHGNIYEWVEDCWNNNYHGAPADGSAWITGNCDRRALRGGAYNFAPWHLRSAARGEVATATEGAVVTGVRVARSLTAKK